MDPRYDYSVVDIIVREGESRGLILSRAATVHPPSLPKSVVWSPLDGIGDNEQDPLLRGIPKVKAGDGIVVLGAPVGYHAFVKEKLKSKVEKVRGILELLPLLQDPHCEFVFAEDHVHAESCQHCRLPGSADRVRLPHQGRPFPPPWLSFNRCSVGTSLPASSDGRIGISFSC